MPVSYPSSSSTPLREVRIPNFVIDDQYLNHLAELYRTAKTWKRLLSAWRRSQQMWDSNSPTSAKIRQIWGTRQKSAKRSMIVVKSPSRQLLGRIKNSRSFATLRMTLRRFFGFATLGTTAINLLGEDWEIMLALAEETAPLKPTAGLNGPPVRLTAPLKPKAGLNGPPGQLSHICQKQADMGHQAAGFIEKSPAVRGRTLSGDASLRSA